MAEGSTSAAASVSRPPPSPPSQGGNFFCRLVSGSQVQPGNPLPRGSTSAAASVSCKNLLLLETQRGKLLNLSLNLKKRHGKE